MASALLRLALLPLLILASMLWSSLAVYDAHKMQDALRWRQAVLAGQSPLAWSFDSRAELTGGHGLETFRWSEGTLRGDLTDPYFYLNLEGRFVDAQRFPLLRLRLYSTEGSYLQLFHHQFRDDQIHAGSPVPLVPGWQTVELDLASLSWHRKFLDGSHPDEPSQWGTADGLVSALRIDPVQEGAFAVDELALLPSQVIDTATGGVQSFAKLDDPLFERMRGDRERTWLIAHDAVLRTPEVAHWTREAVAREFPSAVLFPRPPTPGELAGSIPGDPRLPGYLPALVFILAFMVYAVGKRRAGSWGPLLELAGLLGALGAYVFLMPRLSGVFSLLVAVPILLLIWQMRPQPLRPWLWGDARAWLLLSPLLLIALAMMVLFPDEGPEAGSVPQALLDYFIWALLQQFVLAVLILNRLRTVLGPGAVVLSAGIFGYMHFPNFALMAGTFVLGLALLQVYQRHRNLLAIATTHALLAVGFNGLASAYFWLSRAVGPAFLLPL